MSLGALNKTKPNYNKHSAFACVFNIIYPTWEYVLNDVDDDDDDGDDDGDDYHYYLPMLLHVFHSSIHLQNHLFIHS